MLKCTICEEYKDENLIIKGICLECFKSTPSTFDINLNFRIVCVLECETHGKYISGSYNGKCPTCIIPKCRVCGELKDLNKHGICDECYDNYSAADFIKDGFNGVVYVLCCKEHGKYFGTTSRTQCLTCIIPRCKSCLKQVKLNKYSLCDYCWENLPSQIDKSIDYDMVYILECETHGNILVTGTASVCSICSPKLCKGCDEENKELNEWKVCHDCWENLPFNFEMNDDVYRVFLLECPNDGRFISSSSIGKCPTCECKPVKCRKCKNLLIFGDICDCGFDTRFNDGYKCLKCNNPLKSVLSICDKCKYDPHMAFDKRCWNCGELVGFYDFTCKNCGCGSQTNSKSYFETKNGVRYYKGELITDIIEKLENGEYDVKDFNGWNKRYDRWCYNTFDVLTDERLLLNGHGFEIHDEELFYLDKITGKYVPWNDYKSKFKTREDSGQLKEFGEMTAFRTQDSENWEGAVGAFERSLVEAELTWIVYVKYYINEESDFNPLVIGKTSSKLVNVSGTDVIFDYDTKNGPARQFLIEEGYDWNKTQVGVIGCKTEKEALILENKLQKKYGLFGS